MPVPPGLSTRMAKSPTIGLVATPLSEELLALEWDLDLERANADGAGSGC